MSVMWSEEWCPKCEIINWIYHGNMDDMTVVDIDGCECYKCGHEWLFDEELAKDYHNEESISEIITKIAYIEKGLEKPR